MAAPLISLLRSSTITDHDEILAVATTAASANPSDIFAQHTRVVALLKLDRFDDALAVLSQAGDAVTRHCSAEKAYALYKTGRLDEASAALSASSSSSISDGREQQGKPNPSADGLDAKTAHITAQVAYRAERFADAFATYTALLSSHGESGGTPEAEHGDLVINLAATAAQIFLSGQGGPGEVWQRVLQDPDEIEGSFETLYNFACEYLARGDVAKAESLLGRSLAQCEAAEDLSDPEREAEKLPILAQRAYVLGRLGRTQDALQALESVVSSKSCPAELLAIARNNLVATTAATCKNPYMVQRDLQSLNASKRPDSLFSFQTRHLDCNALVADLQAQKLPGVISRTANLLSSTPQPSTSTTASCLSSLNAAAHLALNAQSNFANTSPSPIKHLQGLAVKSPHDLGLVLTLAQLQANAGNYEAALRDVRAFLRRQEARGDADEAAKNIRYTPGLLALSMALHRQLNHQPLLRLELARVVAHCTKHDIPTSPLFLQEAGIELLQSPAPGHLALAGAAFESLCSDGNPSQIAWAGLVASFATTTPSKAEPYLSSLPPVHSLIAGIDVESLIQGGIATAPKTAQPDASSKKRAADEAGAAAGKPKPKRRRKLPKNYEEGKVPDPERWLPLRDRSSYKPKGRKGRKKMAEATQGGIVKDDETLESTGPAKVERPLMPTPAAANKRKKRGKK